MDFYNNNDIAYFYSAHIHQASSLERRSTTTLAWPSGANSIQVIPFYQYPINTWEENDECRSMSCQRTLLPYQGLNP